MSKTMMAATIAGGLSLMSGEAFACGDPAQNKDMVVELAMVPHQDILPIEQKKVFANGSTTIMTKDKTWSESGVTYRCPMPTSYEFQIETDLLDDALVSQEPVHISLDTNYDAGKDDLRGCVNIPVIGVEIKRE